MQPMKSPLRQAICLAAACGVAGLAQPVLAAGVGNACKFQAKGLSLAFGSLNPSAAVTKTVSAVAATANADKMGDCAPGQHMTLTSDNGLNYSGSLRLKKSGTADYIPYSLAFPTTLTGQGSGSYVTFTFSGTVLGPDYANAPAGAYSDTVIISVSP
jgi:spore coat protein U-like protein